MVLYAYTAIIATFYSPVYSSVNTTAAINTAFYSPVYSSVYSSFNASPST